MELGKNKQKLISLKKAGQISGYAPDYVGYLIRRKKISGKKIFSGSKWLVARRDLFRYLAKKKKTEERKFSFFDRKYISLKEASNISGYAPDHIGYLIREKQLSGKQIYFNVKWLTTEEAIENYLEIKRRRKSSLALLSFYFEKVFERIVVLFLRTTKYGAAAIILSIIISGSLIAWALVPRSPVQTVEIYPGQIHGQWHNLKNALGPPGVGPQGNINYFSEGNSAVYKKGPQVLVLSGFQFTQPDLGLEKQEIKEEEKNLSDPEAAAEEVVTEEPAEEEEEEPFDDAQGKETEPFDDAQDEEKEPFDDAQDKEAEPFGNAQGEEKEPFGNAQGEETETGEELSFFHKIRNVFQENFARAQEIPRFEELKEKEFLSAKIKFSFSLGEKEIDLFIDEIKRENLEEETGFWQKAISLAGTIWQRTKNIFAGMQTVFAQENGNNKEVQKETEPFDDAQGEEAEPFDDAQGEETEEIILLPESDVKIVVSYALADKEWNVLAVLAGVEFSNALNKGYFAYQAPFLKNWQDIENLQIKFEGVVGGETRLIAYLDSVWVEVEYQEEEIAEELILETPRKDWKVGETPEFTIKKTGGKQQAGLMASISSLFDRKPELKEIVLRLPKNKEIFLEKGNQISVEQSSPINIKLTDTKSLKPGKHTLKAEIEWKGKTHVLEQDFTWGVLAININKSIFMANPKPQIPNSKQTPNSNDQNSKINAEMAYIQMGVLDDQGHTICDADLELRIKNQELGIDEYFSTDPSASSGQVIEYSNVCAGNSYVEVPDYYSYYELPSEVGIYELELTAHTTNGTRTITDSFEIRESTPFDVERIGPTRIYPPADYEVKIIIKVNRDFEGEIIETVPNSFAVNDQFSIFNFQSISNDSIFKKLIWEAELEVGETYELSYTFNAPNISPYIYMLGPLRFSDKGQAIIFEENRQWQVAADDTTNFSFTFDSNAEDWSSGNVGPNTTLSWSDVTGCPSAGSLRTHATKASGGDTTSNNYWQWTGTWEDLDVPQGHIVTQVSGGYRYTVTAYGNAANQTGPLEFRVGSGCSLEGNLLTSAAITETVACTTRSQGSAVNVPSNYRASGSSICLRLNNTSNLGGGARTFTMFEDTIDLTITHEPAAVEAVSVETQPATTTAGQTISGPPAAFVEDELGNPVSGVSVTVSLNTGSFASGSTITTSTDSHGIATFNNLKINTAGTYRLIFNADGVEDDAESDDFNVIAAGANNVLVETQPATTTAGQTISGPPAAFVEDEFGNPVSGVSVTVSLNSGSFASGSTITTSTDSHGIATFNNLKINTVGNYKIIFNASGVVFDAESEEFVIEVADPYSISMVTEPETSVAGQTIAGPPSVRLRDQFNNIVEQSGINITAVPDSGSFTLGSTTTVSTDVQGIATFNNLVLETAGIYEIEFEADGLESAFSSPFEVEAGSADTVSVETQPSYSIVKRAVGGPPSALVTDEFGNAVQGINVSASLNTGSFATGSVTTTTTDAYGIAVFNNLIINTVGAYRIIFDASGVAIDAESDEFNVGPEKLYPIKEISKSNLSGQISYLQHDPRTAAASNNWYTAGTGQASTLLNVLLDEPAGNLAGTQTIRFLLRRTVAASGDRIPTASIYLYQDNVLMATFVENRNVESTTGEIWTYTFEAGDLDDILGQDLEIRIVGNVSSGPSGQQTTPEYGAIEWEASLMEMAMETQPQTTLVNYQIQGPPAVFVSDSSDNPESGVDVNVSLNSGSFSQNSTTTVTSDANGLAVFDNLIIETPGTYYLIFSISGVSYNLLSDYFEIEESNAVAVTVETEPATTTAGEIIGHFMGQYPSVFVEDDQGEPVEMVGVNVSLNSGSFASGTIRVITNAQGIATFDNLVINTVGTYRLIFDAEGVEDDAESDDFNVIAASADSVTVETEPATTTAGQTISGPPAAFVEDEFGNPVPGVNVTVSLNTGSFAPGSTITTSTDSHGIATFNNLVINTAGTYRLIFDADGVEDDAESDDFNIIAASADSVTVKTQPATTTAGEIIGESITDYPAAFVEDEFGNPVPGVNVTVDLNTGSFASGTLTVTTNAQGIATFNNLVINTAGTYRLIFDADGVEDDAESDDFNVEVGDPDKVVIQTEPQNTVAGQVIGGPPTVRIEDAAGNTIEQAGIEVSVTLHSGSFTVGSTTTVSTNESGVAVFNNLVVETAGVYNLEFEATDVLNNGFSGLFEIEPSDPDSVSVHVQPQTTFINQAIGGPPTAIVKDEFENPVPGVSVKVSLEEGDFASGATTTDTDSSGLAVFNNLTISVRGTYRMIFDADNVETDVYSNYFDIEIIEPVFMYIDTEPSTTTAGEVIGQETDQYPAVYIEDEEEQPVHGANVTVSLNSGSFAEESTLTVITNIHGIALFDNLIINNIGTYKLIFEASGAAEELESSDFVIEAADPYLISIITEPGKTTAGQTIAGPPSVRLRDQFNNIVEQSGINITAVPDSGSFTLGSTTTVSTDAQGIATFNNLVLETAGIYEIEFEADGLESAFSSPFEVEPAAPDSAIIETEPQDTFIGKAINGPPAVLVEDEFGNPVPGINIEATLDQGEFYSGTAILSTNNGGLAVFDNLVIGIIGTYQLIFDVTGFEQDLNSESFDILKERLYPEEEIAGTSNVTGTIEYLRHNPSADSAANDWYEVINSDQGNQLNVRMDEPSDSLGGIQTIRFLIRRTNNSTRIAPVTINLYQDGEFIKTLADYRGVSNATGEIWTYQFKASELNDISGKNLELRIQGFSSGGPEGERNTAEYGAIEWEATYRLEASINTQPQNSIAGEIIGGPPTILVKDIYGNPAQGVEVFVSPDSGSFTPGSTTTVSTDENGIVIFNNLVIETAGIYEMEFDIDSINDNLFSQPFEIEAGDPYAVSVKTQPIDTIVGEIIGGPPAALVEDIFTNPTSDVSVSVSLDSGSFALGSTTTVITNSEGIAVFDNLIINEIGTYEMIFNAQGVVGDATSSPFEILPSIIVSGTVFTDQGITTSSAESLVSLAIDGELIATTTVLATGEYEFSGLGLMEANAPITVFINDSVSGESGAAITRYQGNQENIENLDIYIERIIIRHEDSGPVSNSNISHYLTNTPFTVSGDNLSIDSGHKLIVWQGKKFIPGGNVTIPASDNSENPGGDLEIQTGSELDMQSNTLSIGGNYINNGTFLKASNQTTIFTAASSGHTLSQNMTATSSFENIQFNGSGGAWEFNNNAAINNDFTVSNGTVVAPGELFIGGSWFNSGTFVHNDGKVTFNGSGTKEINDGGSAFYDIVFDGSGSTWLYQDGSVTAPNSTSVSDGEVIFLNTKTGSVNVSGGTLSVDWYLGIELVEEASDEENKVATDEDSITVSENSTTSQNTIFRHDGNNWGSPLSVQYTRTLSSGISPQPNNSGAIRIREYQMTGEGVTAYLYNLSIDSQNGFIFYDYYDDEGEKYITSVEHGDSEHDTVIGEDWHREIIASVNPGQLNQPPDTGTWYIEMKFYFSFSIDLNVNMGVLNEMNIWTNTGTSTLDVETAFPGGYTILAYGDHNGRMKMEEEEEFVQRFDYENTSPGSWSGNCHEDEECGFGYNTDDSGLPGDNPDRFTNPVFCGAAAGEQCWAGFDISRETASALAYNDSATEGVETTTVIYKLSVLQMTKAGNYSTTIFYIATANYE